MNPTVQAIRRIAAALVGILFVVSGLLKIIDPVGTMLIVTEYCKFFHIGFLIPAAKGIGIVLATLEALLGIALITGVLRKVAAVCAYVMLGVFTVITLVLWIVNPVMDCGCFGQAVHLTHAQSFLKNLVLLGLCVLAFTPLKDMGRPKPRKIVSAALALVSILFAVVYSNTHLPIVDFTAFDWGAELFASLEDDVTGDNHYQPVFIYEKDGQRGTFTLNTLPDSTWTFVAQDTLYRPTVGMSGEYPILGFRDAEGEYRDRMAAEGKVVVFSVYDLKKARWERLQEQYNAVAAAGAMPLVLLASYPAEAARLGAPATLPLYYADYKTLITLNRSNGGGSYFCEGELVHKWPSADFPESIQDTLAEEPVALSTYHIVRRRLKAQGFCVYLAALLLLL